MNEKPKNGDRVEFTYRRLPRMGTVIAVAETGFYFVIETPNTKRMTRRRLRIPLSKIIRILNIG